MYNYTKNLSKSCLSDIVDNFNGSGSDEMNSNISPRTHANTPSSNDNSDKPNASLGSSKNSERSHVSDDFGDYSIDVLEKTITDDDQRNVSETIESISKWSELKQMLFQAKSYYSYLNSIDDLKDPNQTYDASGINQADHMHALNWAKTHLKEDSSQCLFKDNVYTDYKSYCTSDNQKTLTVADFGKVMKKAYPNVKARRLGPRGSSRYCYAGLTMMNKIIVPKIIDTKCGMSTAIDNDSVNSFSPANTTDFTLNQYDFGTDIVADAGHVLLEYLRSSLKTKSINSVKEAVKLILYNGEVNTTTSHACKLLNVFRDSVNEKFKNDVHIKKEATISGTSPKSSTTTHSGTSSPMSQKRTRLIPSPGPEKMNHSRHLDLKSCTSSPAPINYPYPGYGPATSNGYSGAPSDPVFFNTVQMSHSTGLTNPHMVGKTLPHSSFSTPIKNEGVPLLLESPLLDQSPSSRKRLKLVDPPISHKSYQYPTQLPPSSVYSQPTLQHQPQPALHQQQPMYQHYPVEDSVTTNCFPGRRSADLNSSNSSYCLFGMPVIDRGAPSPAAHDYIIGDADTFGLSDIPQNVDRNEKFEDDDLVTPPSSPSAEENQNKPRNNATQNNSYARQPDFGAMSSLKRDVSDHSSMYVQHPGFSVNFNTVNLAQQPSGSHHQDYGVSSSSRI